MTLINKIKDSVELFCPFVYGSPEAVNMLVDDVSNIEQTFCYAYLLDSGNVVQGNGILRERITMALFFVSHVDFDSDINAIETEEAFIEGSLNKYALPWYMNNLDGRAGFDIQLNGTQRVYREHDAMVSGVALNVTITNHDGVTVCG